MNPTDGNIYTKDQASSLGLHFDELIPLLEHGEAIRLLKQRRAQASKLKNRQKDKAAKQARKHNR